MAKSKVPDDLVHFILETRRYRETIRPRLMRLYPLSERHERLAALDRDLREALALAEELLADHKTSVPAR